MVPTSIDAMTATLGADCPSSNPELCLEFLSFEEKFDLFQQRIDDVPFWEYLRFYVFLELQRSLGLAQLKPFQAGSSWSRWLKLLASSLSGLFLHNPFFTGPKELFFFGCPRRSREADGLWWDTLIDPFLDNLDRSFYYIERYNEDRHHKPARTRHVKYFDLLSMIACGYRLLRPGRGFSSTAERQLLQIQNDLCQFFNVVVDLVGMASSIWKTRQCLLALFEELFRKTQPRAVFFVSINYPERAALEVCKRMGIPAIELQHGVIGPYDLCYVFPKNVELHLFPDYLLVYGQYWKECINYPLFPERVIPIGYPHLEARLKEYSQVEKLNQGVFLSQPTVGEKLSRFAVELSRRPNFPYQLIYRLHPYETEWRKRYPWLAESSIEVSSSQDSSLHSLFARSRIQFGVYSAALFEGLAFGLTTYLVPLPGFEYMQSLVEQGWCRLVKDPWQVPTGFDHTISINNDFFFRPGGVDQFLGTLEDIVGEWSFRKKDEFVNGK